MSPSLRFFKLSGALEAFSYLALLLIAMPLKYAWEMPVFVRWTGLFHGLFFLLFCLAIAIAILRDNWPLRMAVLAFLSAFVPFGPFLFERRYLDQLSPPAPPPRDSRE